MFPFYSTFCHCLGVVLFSSVLVWVGLHGSIEFFSVQWLYFGAMCWGFCCLYGGEDRALISIQYWLCDTLCCKESLGKIWDLGSFHPDFHSIENKLIRIDSLLSNFWTTNTMVWVYLKCMLNESDTSYFELPVLGSTMLFAEGGDYDYCQMPVVPLNKGTTT